MNREKFWLDDIRELYQNNKYTKIFPTCRNMTKTEQINAITRLCLYSILLIALLDDDYYNNFICVPIILITIGVVYYNLDIKNNNTNNIKSIKSINKVGSNTNTSQISTTYLNNKHNNKEDDLKSLYTNSDVYSYESVNMHDNSNSNSNSNSNTDNLAGQMNTDITDFNVPAASNSDDEDINDNQELQFSPDLFMSTTEVFDKKHMERQFYTVPNTAVPNNQVEFAKWLYSGYPTCKNDQTQCFRQTELRRNNGQLNPY